MRGGRLLCGIARDGIPRRCNVACHFARRRHRVSVKRRDSDWRAGGGDSRRVGHRFFTKRGAIKEDTAIGILFAASLSLGVALISTIKTYALDLTHILFGNVLGVSNTDLYLIAVLGLVVVVTIVLLYKELLVVSFDPVLAATLRLPTDLLKNVLLVLIAFTVVISLQTVGVGLVTALLVTPAATAFLLTRRLPTMMVVAGSLGALSSIIGLYASYYLNIASGAAVVLTATLFFFVTYVFAPQRGLIWGLVRRTSRSNPVIEVHG